MSFEEQAIVRRLLWLYRARGQEKTPQHIIDEATRLTMLLRCGRMEAYEHIEWHVTRRRQRERAD